MTARLVLAGLPVLVLVGVACGPSIGFDSSDEGADGEAASTIGWGEPEATGHLRSRIETARDKFILMAEAVPDDAWNYRPMEGVRSFGEVFIHVAADNWVPLWMDLDLTESAPISRSMEELGAYQADARPRTETVTELERSFAYLLSALDASAGRMEQRFMLGEREWEVGEAWIALTTHMHEHLGQSIAYARANEIVPPWSADS